MSGHATSLIWLQQSLSMTSQIHAADISWRRVPGITLPFAPPMSLMMHYINKVQEWMMQAEKREGYRIQENWSGADCL